MTIKKIYNFEVPVIINSFKNHYEIKNKLISIIDSKTYAKSEFFEPAEVNISRGDWDKNRDYDREWVNFIFPEISETILETINEIGYRSFNINEIWFQQYEESSMHGWHIHGSNFTGIYYVELPKGTPPTEILNPSTKKEIISLEVKEGDIVIAPSYFLHRAPKNNSNKRKTIIAFNLDVGYPDEFYGMEIPNE